MQQFILEQVGELVHSRYVHLSGGGGYYGLFGILYKIIYEKDHEQKCLFRGTALYFAIILGVMLTNLSIQGLVYTSDYANIFRMALELYPFTFGLTSGVYIISLMMFPFPIAPSIIKIVFQSLMVGYIVYRTSKHYKTKWAYLIYGVFLLPPILWSSATIHRMQWYVLLYLGIAVKLFYDYKENKKITLKEFILISILISVLTIWRREGIYLIVLGPLLLLVTYGFEKKWKQQMLLFLAIECIIAFPLRWSERNGMPEEIIAWRALAVHMLAEKDLDRDKYYGEVAAIGKDLSIDIIDKYNKDYGNSAYADVHWSWKGFENDKYFAVLQDSELDRENMKKNVAKLIIQEPKLFLTTRVKAWNHVAAKENINNLYIPLVLSVFICLYGLIKKNYVQFLLFFGVLGHTILTSLTMPATYFKYFYVLYLMAYIFSIIVLIEENKT